MGATQVLQQGKERYKMAENMRIAPGTGKVIYDCVKCPNFRTKHSDHHSIFYCGSTMKRFAELALYAELTRQEIPDECPLPKPREGFAAAVNVVDAVAEEINKGFRNVREVEPEHKTPFELLDLDFAAAMCGCWQAGIKDGRRANGWKNMEWTPDTEQEYKAKILRHLQAYFNADSPKEAQQHAVAIACDANILWFHEEGKNDECDD